MARTFIYFALFLLLLTGCHTTPDEGADRGFPHEDSPTPTTCPFGHTALHWKKVDWVCIPLPDELACDICQFAYHPWLKRWEGASRLVDASPMVLPGFSEFVRQTPLPTDQEARKSVYFRQIRKVKDVVQESCSYWTREEIQKVRATLRRYLTDNHLKVVEDEWPYAGRVYYHYYAKYSDRYLLLELILENENAWVELKILHPSAIEYEFRMKKALGIEPNEQMGEGL